MASDSRERMVRSAADLIGTRGMSATSFADVIEASGAPRGSIYHHFPEGKRQLAEEAMRWTAQRVLAHQRAGEFTTPQAVLERFIDMWRQVVLSSKGTAGCVVAGVTIDSPSNAAAGGPDRELLDVARATFRAWSGLLSDQLAELGVPDDRARAIGSMTLAGMEGALVLCRAESSVEPLDIVAAELLRLLPSPT